MPLITNKLVVPFLKWAGGKRQLLPEIQKHRPPRFKNYAEPFLGGGAVLFHLQPKIAIVNDINKELVNVYQVIRDNVDDLVKSLKKHSNDPTHYYKTRKQDRTQRYNIMSNITKAARIIYLNKTCYNGLFRVNSHGQFNVPFGKYKNPNFINETTLRAVSLYLNKNEIRFYNQDFYSFIKKIKEDSFVYLDPPYHPVSDSSSFTGYALGGFKKEDQVRLRQACDLLVKKRCKVLLSNSYTKFIVNLYSDPKYKIIKVEASRNINSISTQRGKIYEALIKSY